MVIAYRFLAFLLCLGCVWSVPVYGNTMPLLMPSIYSGECIEQEQSYQAFLSLCSSQEFFLQEKTSLSNGKVSSWETTGRWYQIRNNTCLQLTNIKGFHRILNIGGDGVLYLTIQFPGGSQATVILQKQKVSPLEDGICRKENMSPQMQPFSITNTPHQFRESIIGNRWKITRVEKSLKPLPVTAYLFFSPEREALQGTLDIFDGVLHTTGKYALEGNDLSLSVKVRNTLVAKMLKQTQSWQLTGEVLELWGEKHIVGLLEKF